MNLFVAVVLTILLVSASRDVRGRAADEGYYYFAATQDGQLSVRFNVLEKSIVVQDLGQPAHFCGPTEPEMCIRSRDIRLEVPRDLQLIVGREWQINQTRYKYQGQRFIKFRGNTVHVEFFESIVPDVSKAVFTVSRNLGVLSFSITVDGRTAHYELASDLRKGFPLFPSESDLGVNGVIH